jgi:uncharacterized protein
MSSEYIEALRRQKDLFFRSDPASPLAMEARENFQGLRYYEYNPELDLVVTVQRFASGDHIPVYTTTDELRSYRRYGEFTFTVDGVEARLTIYETPNGFFLPFVDAGAGRETYPAGRYLEPEPLTEDTFRVDFNLAYNPFCVYSDGWSCPITPAENRLTVAIRAGEKLPDTL